MVFVETAVFTRRVQEHLNDDDYAALQTFWLTAPERARLSKVQVVYANYAGREADEGKRGGLRVIYYWWTAKDRISMLTVYAKNERDDLTADQLKQLRSQLIL